MTGTNTATTTRASAGDLDIGRRNSGTINSDGFFFDFRFYNRALSYGEVKDISCRPWRLYEGHDRVRANVAAVQTLATFMYDDPQRPPCALIPY